MTPTEQDIWISFTSESAETLRAVEESLLRLEEEATNQEEINCLYRGLHTLKGNAGFLALASFERVAHACEDLVGLVRDDGVALDGAMMELLLSAVDLLRNALEVIKEQRRDLDEASVEALVAQIHSLYKARGGAVKAAPTIVGFEIFDDPEESAAPPSPVLTSPSEVLIGAEEEALRPETAGATASAFYPSAALPKQDPSRRPAEADANDILRINAGKVATLMELAGELGLACSAVTQQQAGRDPEAFAAAAHKLELLVKDLQNDLSSLRLVPVVPVFQRMRRVVRDASRRTNKKVELRLLGEETEIDKIMLDALQDPLVHVLRNAIDHGLETEEERVLAGKPPTGKVTLSAAYQGGEVTIEVRDDGRGLNYERILARAKQRGLCPIDAHPSEDEIASFVFLPGFSTKDVADELSGRGVGMDVLKTTIEGLRGRTRIKSTPGQVSKITQEQIASNSADGLTLLRVRGLLAPVLWLHKFWDEERQSTELEGRVVVFVQTAHGVLALPVDELIGNQQVMVKPLRGVLSGMKAATGCGMLRTGDIAVALDCEQLHV